MPTQKNAVAVVRLRLHRFGAAADWHHLQLAQFILTTGQSPAHLLFTGMSKIGVATKVSNACFGKMVIILLKLSTVGVSCITCVDNLSTCI